MNNLLRHRRSSVFLVSVLFVSPPSAASAFSASLSPSRNQRYPRVLPRTPSQCSLRVKGEQRFVAPLRMTPKENNKAESQRNKVFQHVSSLVFATLLAISVQAFVAVSPSEASSYGQFSASVSPPKTAVSIAEQSGKTKEKTKGVATCQPVSVVSSLNSNLSPKCKAAPVSSENDESFADPMEAQVIGHQQLLDNLAKEPDWFNYVAAFSASVISTLVIHPLDTIKVRLMTDGSGEDDDGSDEAEEGTYREQMAGMLSMINETTQTTALPSSDAHAVSSASTPMSYSTPVESSTALSAATSVYGNSIPAPIGALERFLEDMRSLYSGIIPNIVKEGPPSALYLGLYESSIVLLKQYPFFTDHKLIMYLLAGAIGEFVGSVVRAPAEAVKTRVQAGGSTLGEAIQTVFLTKEGRLNTFRAWSSSLFRDVPAGAVQIAIFEALKLFLITTPYINVDIDNLFSESLLGGIGGGIGAFLTTPSDRVTTMIISSEDEISALDGAKQIWNDQGPNGFFVGSTERSSYWFFAVGIFLSAYCALRQAAIPFFVH
mmetsp:Transcript_35862/g.78574  ORF Transcript_35862/g.78574 Transcript_35862/m.78574 type:complete len:546 (-) Transcript_35862:152-1789(-)